MALGYLAPHSSDSSHLLALRKVAVAVEQKLFSRIRYYPQYKAQTGVDAHGGTFQWEVWFCPHQPSSINVSFIEPCHIAYTAVQQQLNFHHYH